MKTEHSSKDDMPRSNYVIFFQPSPKRVMSKAGGRRHSGVKEGTGLVGGGAAKINKQQP